MSAIHRLLVELQAELEQAKRNLQQVQEHLYQKGYQEGEAVAEKAAKEREARLVSLLQRARAIMTIDVPQFTIWLEDVGEELARKEGA